MPFRRSDMGPIRIALSNMLDDHDTSPINSSCPFGKADPLMIDYDPRKDLSIRVFIDDLISIVLATEALIPRAIHAVPLVLDSVFRPNFDDKLVNRNPILSQTKLLIEGACYFSLTLTN